MPRIEIESNVGRNLEGLVDANGLAAVLLALSEICSAKAEHVTTNWNDEQLSLQWARSSARLDTLASAKCVKSLDW